MTLRRTLSLLCLFVAMLSTGEPSRAAGLLQVGPGLAFETPSAAAAAARDGDTILIAPGDYRGDVAVWSANRLRIVGGNPRPRVYADGRSAEGKAIWVVRGADVTIENVELSGAAVPDRNGAAIRAEGRNLTLRDCYLHDNQNGLLSGANATSEILVERCEFARNGGGDGQTHNLYIGAIARLDVRASDFHHAVVGHQLKSRAAVSVLTGNRFADELDGTASYEAEFPNGGRVTLEDNVFQKGPRAQNATLVSYGAEGLAPSGDHALVARGNTFVSRRPGARFLFVAPTARVTLVGNVFAGPGSLPDAAVLGTRNVVRETVDASLDAIPKRGR